MMITCFLFLAAAFLQAFHFSPVQNSAVEEENKGFKVDIPKILFPKDGLFLTSKSTSPVSPGTILASTRSSSVSPRSGKLTSIDNMDVVDGIPNVGSLKPSLSSSSSYSELARAALTPRSTKATEKEN